MKAKLLNIFILFFLFLPIVNISAETNPNLITNNDYLITTGSKIKKKANGETVVLKGLNVGGWLLQTVYMSPVSAGGKVIDQTYINKTLINRFGSSKASELLNTHYDNYLTTFDLDEIAKTGANVVRVPFWWKNFMNEDGTFIYKNGNIDFSKLDWLIRECNKRGLYVILSLHGAPGSQNGSHASGFQTSNPTLFAQNQEGINNRTITVKLWKQIAKYFSGNPTIAGFDILSESYGPNASDKHTNIWNLYDWIYKEIRSVDPDRIIIMETAWDIPELAKFGKFKNWSNTIYSTHDYMLTGEKNTQNLKAYFDNKVNEHLSTIRTYNIPIYVGETSCYDYWDACSYAFNLYLKNEISITPWSYKTPINNYWGVMYRNSNTGYANIETFSFENIKKRWSYQTKESMTLNTTGRNLLIKSFGGRIVTGISLNKKEASIKSGETITLTAQISPNNAINKDIIWLSSNNAIATVNNGIITGKTPGNVYIVAKSKENDQIKASVSITVLPIKVQNITLNKTSLSAIEEETIKLTATINPENATNKNMIWETSNTKIATVDQNGNVTAKTVGLVNITVKAKENNNIKAVATITVNPKPSKNIVLNISKLELYENTSFKLMVTTTPNNQDIIWETNNSDIVTIDQNGNLLTKNSGIATITVKLKNDSTISTKCDIIVEKKPLIIIPIKNIVLNKNNLNINAGETTKLAATIYPTDTSIKSLIWTSSNSDIAAVDQEGNVTAKNIGTTEIIVKSKENPNITSKTIITVNKSNNQNIALENIYLNKSLLSLYKGTSIKLTVNYIPNNATNKNIEWKSSDSNIIDVDQNGNILAVNTGTATITATSVENVNFKSECVITVEDKPNINIPIENIHLNYKELVMDKNETINLNVTIKPNNATDPTIIWLSSNEKIATVDQEGNITAKSAGEVEIIILAKEDTNITSVLNLTVKEPQTNNNIGFIVSLISSILFIIILGYIIIKKNKVLKKTM